MKRYNPLTWTYAAAAIAGVVVYAYDELVTPLPVWACAVVGLLWGVLAQLVRMRRRDEQLQRELAAAMRVREEARSAAVSLVLLVTAATRRNQSN